MRPLELEVENFRSYFGSGAVFDFRNRTLVGIVGPIGSGKSSLLDAISYALYGRTPTAGAATRSLIHQRADDGGVRFRFEVDGEVWEAVRRLRRTGASQHSLYRYEGDVASTADPVERITLEGDVNDRIVQLIGLDFAAFGRSVLLAQGRFAEFLASRPAERDAVLKGVFGHDRIDAMREVAKQRKADAAGRMDKVAFRVEQHEAMAARVAEAKVSLATAETHLRRLVEAAPRVAALDASMEEAAASRAKGDERLAELDRHASRLPRPDSAERLASEAADHAGRRRSLADDLASAREDLTAAEAAASAAQEAGDAATVEEAGVLVVGLARLRRTLDEAARRGETAERNHRAAESHLVEMEERLASAVAAGQAAATDLQRAGAAVEVAEEAHHAAQHGDMAATLRAQLVAGDDCPVCAQGVVEVPASSEAVDVVAAQRHLEEVRQARDEAEERRSAALASRSGAQEAAEAARQRLAAAAIQRDEAAKAEAEARDDLTTTVASLTRLLGEGDPEALLEEKRRSVAALGDAVTAARRRLDQVRALHDQAIVDEQGIEKQLTELRIAVSDLAARLDADRLTEVGEGAAGLAAAVTELRAAWEEETAAVRRTVAHATSTIEEATEERAALMADLGVEGVFAAALATAQAEATHLQTQVARDEKTLAEAADLIAERDRLADEHERYDRIARDLTDARFVRYLLDDERARLADLGSDHFARLSSGRYRFTEDGTFAIVDQTAADAVRKSASLSGGETFLASLALALALAEMVARTGGRLDAFFLDEGFGSLDPEHLDLAMEGIEALVAGDTSRLVVVVSHVPELRHRIEDLIELDRHPLTGDTKVVRS
jgi:exonuclease SbcC